VKTVACVICHSSSSRELIEFNPHIDAVLTHPWRLPGSEDERLWKDLIKGTNIKEFARDRGVKPGVSNLYLSKADNELMSLVKGKKYIAIHPFAGLPHRGCLPHPKDGKYKCFPDYKYPEVVKLLNDRGYTVVIIGRSERGNFKIRQNEEYSEYLQSIEGDVHNLVDIASLRVNVGLARGADGFIGSHSSMLSAAWTNDVPSVFFYPGNDEHGNRRNVRKHGGETGTWNLDQPWNKYFELPSDKFLDLKPSDVVGRLMEAIKAKR